MATDHRSSGPGAADADEHGITALPEEETDAAASGERVPGHTSGRDSDVARHQRARAAQLEPGTGTEPDAGSGHDS